MIDLTTKDLDSISLKFFEEKLEKELKGTITIVDFTADWCQPCHYLAQRIDVLPEYFKKMEGIEIPFHVEKIDIDKGDGRAIFKLIHDLNGVTSIPYLLIFDREGTLIGEVTGANPVAVINLLKKANNGKE